MLIFLLQKETISERWQRGYICYYVRRKTDATSKISDKYVVISSIKIVDKYYNKTIIK